MSLFRALYDWLEQHIFNPLGRKLLGNLGFVALFLLLPAPAGVPLLAHHRFFRRQNRHFRPSKIKFNLQTPFNLLT